MKKKIMSLLAVVVAAGSLAGCDVGISTGYYAGSVWGSDPYCYGWGYGCGYNRYDGIRIGVVYGRRHHRPYHRGRWHDTVDLQGVQADARTTWARSST
jgi:hypothetical protein